MRILMLSQFYPPTIGGEERHVRNLSVELARRGHDVHVGTLELGDSARPPADDPGVTVHQLDNAGRQLPMLYSDPQRPMAMPVPDPVLTRELNRLVKQLEPDVVHAHNWIVNSYLPVKHRRGVPLVLSLHDYSHVCATKRLMRNGDLCEGPAPSRCLPCAGEHYGKPIGTAIYASVQAGRRPRVALVDCFTPVSRFVARANGLTDSDERGAADGSWQVVPNFVPDDLVAAVPEVREADLPAEPYFFFAGDLSAQKGLLHLLDAYSRLPEPRPPLLAVGRPTDDLPATLPAGARVEFGWEHGRVLSGFRHALAAVLPSAWPDPCPTTVLEAMAVGAPLITTHQGGIADMVTDRRSALVVPARGVAELAAAMTELIDDAELRASLVAEGRDRVQAFQCSAVASQLERIYADVSQPDDPSRDDHADESPAATPRRILVATPRAFPLLGGIESHVDEVSARQVANGHDVTIFATDPSGELARTEQRNGATVRRFRAWPRNRDWYASPGLFWGLLRQRYDVLHVQGIHTLVPPLAMLAAILRRKPFVVTFHTGGSSNALRTRARGIQFTLLGPLLKRAAGLVAVSEFEAGRFEAVLGLAPGSIPVIRNGGMPLPLDSDVEIDPDLILSVGRLERYKGHHRVIEALPHILLRRPNARVRILGSGPYEPELRALAAELGVADRVSIEFLPPQQRHLMAEALAQAGVVSLLSDYESHPVAVIEALAIGRPVVVLDNSGFSELVRQGWVLGLPGDVEAQAVAEVLIDQLDNPRRVGAGVLPSWAQCVSELDTVYQSVLKDAARERLTLV